MNTGISTKILILDAYFEPENTSFTHLEKDLFEAFLNAGCELFVICPIPTRGIDKAVAKKYSAIKKEELYGGKVHVKRFWAPQEGSSFLGRAFRYFWCNHKMYSVARKVKNIDIIFSNSTPPIQGLVAAKLAKRLQKPFIYNVQDIFPDSLANIGKIKKNSFLWKIGRRIENKIYASADKLIVISEDFKNNIIKKGVSNEKIRVVYNWVDTNEVRRIPKKENKLFKELGIDLSGFVVVYAGNFGKAQGVKVVFDAAKTLSNYHDIQFVVFGGGSEYDELVDYKEKNAIKNVIIRPLLPQERVSEVYSLGDVNLITCKSGFGHSSLPSKTWSIMACDSRIVASYDPDSELARIIEESGAGLTVEPENPQALADAIITSLHQQSTVNTRDYLLKNANKDRCVNEYVNVIKELL